MKIVKLIKARLKKQYPKANLSTKRLNELSARLAKKLTDESTEEEVDQVLEDANDFYSFEQIAKDDDRVRSLEAKASKVKKNSDDDDDDDEDDDDDDDEDDEPKKKKAKGNDKTLEMLEKINNRLDNIEKGEVTKSKTASAREVFDSNETFSSMQDKELKDFWFSQLDVNSETPIDEQIENQAEVYQKMVQNQADSGQYSSVPGGGKGSSDEPNEDLVDEIAEEI